MGQDMDNPPNVMIDHTPLDVVNSFTYLGATITSNLSLDEEITTKIGKASATMSGSENEYGRTGSLPWQLISASTELASSAPCCTAVKHGHLMPVMK